MSLEDWRRHDDTWRAGSRVEPLVQRLYDDHRLLLQYLNERDEPSFVSALEGTLPKVLLLAAASHLEHRIQEILIDYFRVLTGECAGAVAFVHNKAVSRQYHTYFDWDRRNANRFFALFGPDFRQEMERRCREDAALAGAIAAFMEIGSLRNQLVHQNYAVLTLGKTSQELWDLYVRALEFVELLPRLLPSDRPVAASPDSA
jgi:hypothetical protein